MRSCIKYGDLELYKFCRNELNISKQITEKYLNFVCERQSDEILKYIVEEENIKINSGVLLFAVNKDSLPCVKYLLKLDIHHNLSFDYTFIIIRNGNLEMLKLFLNKFPQFEYTTWNVPFCDNYKLWDYIIDKKIKLNPIFVFISDVNNFGWFKSIDSIKVLERTKILWDEKLTNVLGFFGLFDFLVYVLSKGCKIGSDFLNLLCREYSKEYLVKRKININYKHQKSKCLEYVIENNFIDLENEYVITECNNKEILKTLKENNIKYKVDPMNYRDQFL